MTKKRLVFLVKVAFSLGAIALIYGKVVGRHGATDLLARLREIRWAWIAAAFAVQLAGVTASVLRWDLL